MLDPAVAISGKRILRRRKGTSLGLEPPTISFPFIIFQYPNSTRFFDRNEQTQKKWSSIEGFLSNETLLMLLRKFFF